MRLHVWVATACAATVAAQNLVQALNMTADLSSAYALFASEPVLVTLLANRTNITVLVPNNQAIATWANSSESNITKADLAAMISLHVLNGTYPNFTTLPEFIPSILGPGPYANVTGGQRVQVSNISVVSGYKRLSNITAQPVAFSDGVIHVIDRVLTIPRSFTADLQEFNLTADLGLVEKLNDTDILNYGPEMTVFMPNNDAWARIGSILSTNLTVEELTYILCYHVVNTSTYYSASLSNSSYTTSDGQNLTITKYNESEIFVNQARIVIPDVLLANGVMHIIDNVLNPNNQSARASGTAGQPAYAGQSSVASNSLTQGVATPTSSLDTASIQATATGGSAAAGGGASSSSSSGIAAWLAQPTGAIQAVLAGGIAMALL